MTKDNITSLIVGAGAVEGAWKPIIKALQPYHDFELTPDGANSFLARLVYLLRWWSSVETDLAKEELVKTKKMLIEVRNRISKALKNAEDKGHIKVRPEFEEIIRARVLSRGPGIMLITTNWDNVVGKALKKMLNTKYTKCEVSPLHIHGSCKTPNLMYLPTEVTREPYRSADEDRKIGGIHSSIWQGMESCHHSVVYGLSISPLDAELAQILASGWSNKNLKEIDVITPEHEIVAHRINLLLDRKRDIKINGFDPKDLKTRIDYSVARHKI